MNITVYIEPNIILIKDGKINPVGKQFFIKLKEIVGKENIIFLTNQFFDNWEEINKEHFSDMDGFFYVTDNKKKIHFADENTILIDTDKKTIDEFSSYGIGIMFDENNINEALNYVKKCIEENEWVV